MIAREVAFDQIIVAFDDEDRGGKIEIYEYPDPHHRYVMGLDPSQGVDGGDWTVAFVMDVDSGDQVAEFRATIDPDLAVDQIEWLGIYYNRAYAIIEVNAGYGGPYVRHLADRNTLELYEQKRYDRTVRQFMKKPGFDTTTRTRPLLITEAKTSVRKEIAKIRSLETLKECRTLWENDVGKIEARPGHHDDGFFAYALCLIARNEILGIETMQQEEERKQASFLLQLNRKSRRLDKERKAKIRSRNVARTKHVRAHTTRPGGRRSVI
jgi:hypothetical protein